MQPGIHRLAGLARRRLDLPGGLRLKSAGTNGPDGSLQRRRGPGGQCGAPELAPAEMRSARDKMDRANAAMSAKDYELARLLAEQAQADAQLAVTRARSAKAQKAAAAVQEDSRVLREEIERKAK